MSDLNAPAFVDVWAWGTDPTETRAECGRGFAHLPHETLFGRCPGRPVHVDPRYRGTRPGQAA